LCGILGGVRFNSIMKYRAIVELEFEERDLTQRTLKKARLIGVQELSRVCRVCGCTEWAACEGGCSWVEADLCSKCQEKTKRKTKRNVRSV
jgi:hypothetical protein